MGERLSPILQGIEYQLLYTWYEILNLIAEECPYEYAWIEHPRTGAADDLTLFPKLYIRKPAKFIQIKYHIDHRELVTFELLFGKRPILRKLYYSWQDLKTRGPVEIWVVSNGIPHPNLGVFISARDSSLNRQFFQTGQKAKAASIRRCWKEQLGVLDKELDMFCRDLRLELPFVGIEKLKEMIDERMRYYGLRIGPNPRAAAIDEINTRIQQGGEQKRISRDVLREIVHKRELRSRPSEILSSKIRIYDQEKQKYWLPPAAKRSWTEYLDGQPGHTCAATIHDVGVCLMKLGSLSEGEKLFINSLSIVTSQKNWKLACEVYLSLANLYISQGKLRKALVNVKKALKYARKADDNITICESLRTRGWIAHLEGDLEKGTRYFAIMRTKIEDKLAPINRNLFSLTNVRYGEHLWRIGKSVHAWTTVKWTIDTIKGMKMTHELVRLEDECKCLRFLGKLKADTGDWTIARKHYNEALQMARKISIKEVLIEALLGRGQGAILQGVAVEAQDDLEEALNYAVDSGYCILEADIRVALAKVFQAADNYLAAGHQIERAQQLSSEMGYYWGRIEAEAVSAALEKTTSQS